MTVNFLLYTEIDSRAEAQISQDVLFKIIIYIFFIHILLNFQVKIQAFYYSSSQISLDFEEYNAPNRDEENTYPYKLDKQIADIYY